jgi:hypothetical protein
MTVTDTNTLAEATVSSRNAKHDLHRAIDTAEVCGRCGAAIAVGEPVWRLPACLPFRGRLLRWLTAVCRRCAYRGNAAAKTCAGCGRTLYVYRDTPAVVCCCRRCRQKVYNARRAAAIARRNRLQQCATCGNAYTPKRADSKYCSPACRQRAHRARTAEVRS